MVKKRISISINKDVLEKVDRIVDGINTLSRSEAIEKIIDKYTSEKKKCIIMAGGPPSNLLAGKTYRPLLKIKGKSLIEDIISKVRLAGFEDITIIGSKEVLSEIFKIIGESGIEYLEEKTHLGTAKTLNLCRDKIKSTTLFIACDHYFEVNLADMEKYHRLNKAVATLCVYSGTKYEWNKSSIVVLEGNKILEYDEHPKDNKTHLTSLLIGFIEPELFEYIPKANINYSLQEDVFPQIAKKGLLVGYIYSGKWRNIHKEEDTKI